MERPCRASFSRRASRLIADSTLPRLPLIVKKNPQRLTLKPLDKAVGIVYNALAMELFGAPAQCGSSVNGSQAATSGPGQAPSPQDAQERPARGQAVARGHAGQSSAPTCAPGPAGTALAPSLAAVSGPVSPAARPAARALLRPPTRGAAWMLVGSLVPVKSARIPFLGLAGGTPQPRSATLPERTPGQRPCLLQSWQGAPRPPIPASGRGKRRQETSVLPWRLRWTGHAIRKGNAY